MDDRPRKPRGLAAVPQPRRSEIARMGGRAHGRTALPGWMVDGRAAAHAAIRRLDAEHERLLRILEILDECRRSPAL